MATVVRELPCDADPSMTREARAERAAWRRAHPEAWRADLESLIYFDPDYGHDPGHEYEDDWTTDPDLPATASSLRNTTRTAFWNPSTTAG